MKKIIISIVFSTLYAVCYAQSSSMIDEDMIDQNGKHVIMSIKEKYTMDNGSNYTFRLQAVADETITEWYIIVSSKEKLPYDNVMLLKFDNGEIETLPALVVKSDTTYVFSSSAHSFSSSSIGYSHGSGEEKIDKISYTSTHRVSQEQIDKIALYNITKTRVGDALRYTTKEWTKKNPFGSFINRSRNSMTKSILEIREKRKTVYDGF